MGCGDPCPVVTGKRYFDWELDDPAGKNLAEVRLIRDEVEAPGLIDPSDPPADTLDRQVPPAR